MKVLRVNGSRTYHSGQTCRSLKRRPEEGVRTFRRMTEDEAQRRGLRPCGFCMPKVEQT